MDFQYLNWFTSLLEVHLNLILKINLIKIQWKYTSYCQLGSAGFICLCNMCIYLLLKSIVPWLFIL